MMSMDAAADTKEYFWCTKLDKKSKVFQWSGGDDGVMEQLVLKRACLGPGVKESERNIVQVTSFDHKQNKIEACICSLKSSTHEDVGLADLTIFPPAIFKLIEGSGPIHLVGNHMMMEDGDGDSDDDVSYNEEDISEGDLADLDETTESQVKGKMIAKAQSKSKKTVKDEDDDDEEDDEDFVAMEDMDDDDLNDEDDDEEDEEEEEEEEEVKPVPPSKKRKMSNGNTKENNVKKTVTVTPKKKTETVTPKKKTKQEPTTPKTPLQQQKENKTPVSAKKTPGKTYETVDEVKAAIKKFPGGKPRKEDKFGNWVKSAFKVQDEEWIKDLWKAHKKELGL